MSRWYVVQTQPRKERLAEQQLANQGFVTFCPNRARYRKIGRRMVQVIEPFFPNYLFVSLDIASQAWRSVNGTLGVVRLVGFGKGREAMPAPMPEGLVENFQSRCGENDELWFDEALAPGDRIQVIGGPFDTLCGTLEKLEGADRVIILLDVLSKSTRVRIPGQCLVAA